MNEQTHITQCDAPEYLPFARNRIKAMRATGLKYASQQFDIGGSVVRVRVEGAYSFISISGYLNGYLITPHNDTNPLGVNIKDGIIVPVTSTLKISEVGKVEVVEHTKKRAGEIDWMGKSEKKLLTYSHGLSTRYRLNPQESTREAQPHVYISGAKKGDSTVLIAGAAIATMKEGEITVTKTVAISNIDDTTAVAYVLDDKEWKEVGRVAVGDVRVATGTVVAPQPVQLLDPWFFSPDGTRGASLLGDSIRTTVRKRIIRVVFTYAQQTGVTATFTVGEEVGLITSEGSVTRSGSQTTTEGLGEIITFEPVFVGLQWGTVNFTGYLYYNNITVSNYGSIYRSNSLGFSELVAVDFDKNGAELFVSLRSYNDTGWYNLTDISLGLGRASRFVVEPSGLPSGPLTEVSRVYVGPSNPSYNRQGQQVSGGIGVFINEDKLLYYESSGRSGFVETSYPGSPTTIQGESSDVVTHRISIHALDARTKTAVYEHTKLIAIDKGPVNPNQYTPARLLESSVEAKLILMLGGIERHSEVVYKTPKMSVAKTVEQLIGGIRHGFGGFFGSTQFPTPPAGWRDTTMYPLLSVGEKTKFPVASRKNNQWVVSIDYPASSCSAYAYMAQFNSSTATSVKFHSIVNKNIEIAVTPSPPTGPAPDPKTSWWVVPMYPSQGFSANPICLI